MEKLSLTDLVKKQIAQGIIDKAIRNLISHFSEQENSLINDTILFSTRLSLIKQEDINGTISSENLRIEKAKLSKNIIDWISRVESKNLGIAKPTINYTKYSEPNAKKVILEKILWKDQLQNIDWLQKGIVASKSVCRILIYHENGKIECGTGFIGEKGKLYTCNHVLPNIKVCKNAIVQFNYTKETHENEKSYEEYKLNPEKYFITNPIIDYSIVGLEKDCILPALDCIDMIPQVYDGCPIIQHPNGGYKKIGVHNNIILETTNKPYLHYTTDTEPGSSGSPVFNENWKVLGIHNAFAGSIIWHENKSIYANRGSLMKYIVEDINENNSV